MVPQSRWNTEKRAGRKGREAGSKRARQWQEGDELEEGWKVESAGLETSPPQDPRVLSNGSKIRISNSTTQETHVCGSRILYQWPREYPELALYLKDRLQQSGPSLSNLTDIQPITNSQADYVFEPQPL